jgi:septal ring factor EnvC (AmiA/AmiB activator)
MRKYLIVTVLLSAVLMGLMLFCVKSFTQTDAVQAEILSQSQQLESKKEQLAQKEQELAQLMAQLEKDPDEDREWLQLQEEVQQMEEQKAELETLVQQVEADLEALKQKLRNEDTDQSYFLEVYDALTKGLNDVKGYISGN